MFTGIIQATGVLEHAQESGDGRVIGISLGNLSEHEINPGDSVSVNGACLTVTELVNGKAMFDVSSETLSRCLVGEWQPGYRVNLELAVTTQTRLGGHLVSGHVDGSGKVVMLDRKDEFVCMQIGVDRSLGGFIATKGSVAVDGVSLTVNEVMDEPEVTVFTVMLVPHTLENTTLGQREPGNRVHIEVDMVARYVNRMQEFKGYEH